MIRNIKLRLFEIEHIEIDKIESFDLEPNTSVEINNISFAENLISKVEFVKRNSGTTVGLIINIFIGNLDLGSLISLKDDYVFEINTRLRKYIIRKADIYDYSENKINPLERVQ